MTSTPVPPLLSVVVPTRHRLDALARCLAALAPGAQTLDPARYEVIVTDDGTAPTAETLVREQFPWARWTPGPRRGPAANRNAGARAAGGAWLAFTDDDCVPTPGWLAAFAGRVGDPGRAVRVLEGPTDSGGVFVGVFESVPDNPNGGFLWSCNLAVERVFFLETLGGFDAGFPHAHLEDVEFRMRLEEGGHRWEFVPAARVVHPPRAVGPTTAQARAMESHFYLARRRGISLAAAGLGVHAYVRSRLHGFRYCRSAAEVGRFAVRDVVEAVMLLFLVPRWWWRYRRMPPSSAGSKNPS